MPFGESRWNCARHICLVPQVTLQRAGSLKLGVSAARCRDMEYDTILRTVQLLVNSSGAFCDQGLCWGAALQDRYFSVAFTRLSSMAK